MRHTFSIGVDEVGRGSWAWPVVASACALLSGTVYDFGPMLADSKELSEKKREEIFELIERSSAREECFFWIGSVSSEIIDIVGIREANRLAMEESLRQVLQKLHIFLQKGKKESPKHIFHIQIDGRDSYSFEGIDPKNIEYIVRGDSFIPTIQAASIMAKVSRDRFMKKLSGSYSIYGFGQHKWYGTKLHQTNLAHHGPSDIHRKSYAPIKKLISRANYI